MKDVPVIGKLIDGDAKRDAIHVAIAPVIAAHALCPGERVGFAMSGNTELVRTGVATIGIIDPFLQGTVMEGQRCYLFLYPNTVTSLRHEWTHPSFSDKNEAAHRSEQWLRAFAESNSRTYAELMDSLTSYDPCLPTELYGGELTELWDHVVNVTGKAVDPKFREYTPCSC